MQERLSRVSSPDATLHGYPPSDAASLISMLGFASSMRMKTLDARQRAHNESKLIVARRPRDKGGPPCLGPSAVFGLAMGFR